MDEAEFPSPCLVLTDISEEKYNILKEKYTMAKKKKKKVKEEKEKS